MPEFCFPPKSPSDYFSAKHNQTASVSSINSNISGVTLVEEDERPAMAPRTDTTRSAPGSAVELHFHSPPFKKHYPTSLSISSKDALKIGSRFKDTRYALPPQATLTSLDSIFPEDALVIDVRPFTEYAKSRMKNSINICLPSTLLKRVNFTLERCIATLTSHEKQVFQRIEEQGVKPPAVIIFDADTSQPHKASLTLSQLALKFIQDPGWEKCPLHILKGGFKAVEQTHPDLLESAPAEEEKPVTECSSIPVLSRFLLPAPGERVFRTRHQEELLTARPDSTMCLSTSISSFSQREVEMLPKWVLNVIGQDSGSSQLAQKFHHLEVGERDRLRMALSNTSSSSSPVISSFGLELGAKNRYKDIFPYEHSRVKLTPNPCGRDDYINANYLSANDSHCKYIATQGPLNDTIADFWKVVVNHKTPVILSLTAQNENGVEKCAPFWKEGIYQSGQTRLKLEVMDTQPMTLSTPDSEIILRKLLVSTDKTKHPVVQIQVTNWPDYGAYVRTQDLLQIISIKDAVYDKWQSTGPLLVHCSAGCGRTGTFCAIDTAIDILKKDPHNDSDTFDPILSTVESFRTQRVSMVQTLRQYLLIYDTVILFLRNKVNGKLPDPAWVALLEKL